MTSGFRGRHSWQRIVGLGFLLGVLLLVSAHPAGRPAGWATSSAMLSQETAGLSASAATPDETRRDFHANCFESGCHARKREQRWLHAPFARGACDSCHQLQGPPEKHQYTFVRDKERLCATCHEAPPPKQVRHDPFAKSDCVACHDPHGGGSKGFVPGPDLAPLCARCHDGKAHDGKLIAAGPGKVAFGHSPVARGECNACHLSHQSDHPHLLVREAKLDLCLGCHRSLSSLARAVNGRADGFTLPEPLPVAVAISEMTRPVARPDLLTSGTIPSPPPPDSAAYFVTGPIHGDPFREEAPTDTIEGVIVQLVLVHEPLTRDCLSCHQAHGSDVKNALRAPLAVLCRGCHGDSLAARALRSRSTHRRALEKEDCNACHAGHAGRYAHLLKASSRTLCLRCHDKSLRGEQREIPDIAAQLIEAAAVHEPVEQGCVACHRSHASGERDLLRGSYTTANYAPYSRGAYALCFDCHDPAAIEEESTTLTGFRNGEVNLHHLHVHDRRGRTCDTCHEAHGSRDSGLIRRDAPFGPTRWSLPIEFRKTGTGGSCFAGCHRRLRYDRVTPVARQSGESTGTGAYQPAAPTAG